MLKFALVVLLPLGIIFYEIYMPYLGVSPAEPSAQQKSGKLEKLIVASGKATLELDLNKLNSTNIESKGSKPTVFRFDAAADSFFSIKVFNGELRGPMPGTLPLISQRTADIPAKLSGLLGQLVIEKIAWGDHEIVVRDARTGFTLFEIASHIYDYNPPERSFSIRDGRLLISKEFAEELGRASDSGMVVGKFELSAAMKQIEVSEVLDGEVISNTLPAAVSPESGSVPGPDVVVGDLSDLAQFGNSSGTQVGLAFATDSCNFGTTSLNWRATPDNDHPVIPQNLYRLSGGATNDERFEQIGQSSVKHAFNALAEDICGLGCADPHTGSLLGSGCSDPYSASLNSGQGVPGCTNCLGSRAWINPFTGFFPRNDSATPNNDHSGHTHSNVSHRIVTEISDLSTSSNAGAKYYAEAQYITPHEYAWCQSHPTQCNMYNNVSYRRFNVAGTTPPFAFGTVAGEGTQRMKAAVNAWAGATLVEFRPDPGNDGIGIVAYKVTNPAAGVWHYEYALYNQNLDRAVRTFSVPVGGGNTLSNIGFHAPPQHPGWTADGTVGNAGYSSMPWAQTQSPAAITWNSETFAQNPNANAIRWGTLYNFRFDSNKPPQAANATVGFFKTGAPITVAVQAPSGPAANVSVSGRVTTFGWRGVNYAKVTLTSLGGGSATVYTNSFGFYRFDNVVSGATYTITVTKLRYSFTPQQMAVNDNLTNVNFISGQ